MKLIERTLKSKMFQIGRYLTIQPCHTDINDRENQKFIFVCQKYRPGSVMRPKLLSSRDDISLRAREDYLSRAGSNTQD